MTSVSFGRDTDRPKRVCKVNLAALKVATNHEPDSGGVDMDEVVPGHPDVWSGGSWDCDPVSGVLRWGSSWLE